MYTLSSTVINEHTMSPKSEIICKLHKNHHQHKNRERISNLHCNAIIEYSCRRLSSGFLINCNYHAFVEMIVETRELAEDTSLTVVQRSSRVSS